MRLGFVGDGREGRLPMCGIHAAPFGLIPPKPAVFGAANRGLRKISNIFTLIINSIVGYIDFCEQLHSFSGYS
jgi:hypothetical protein